MLSGPDPGRTAPETLTERLARRDRAITLAGLAVLTLLAWAYLLTGAGLGMSAWDMTRIALFPHAPAMDPAMEMAGMDMAMPPPAPATHFGRAALIAAMWWIMMIAMMAPAATPTILLYARVYRHAVAQGRDRLAPSWAFAAGYLLVWLGFSLAAAALHAVLERTGVVSAMTMGSRSRWLSGGVLIAAGLYQLSPLKNACLSHCRSPAVFLSRHWRPHLSGALRLGARHGAYCVGCCWMLIALLFVGGVMNLVWIAALTLLVTIEKTLPPGRWIGRSAGLVLILWGAGTLISSR